MFHSTAPHQCDNLQICVHYRKTQNAFRSALENIYLRLGHWFGEQAVVLNELQPICLPADNHVLKRWGSKVLQSIHGYLRALVGMADL